MTSGKVKSTGLRIRMEQSDPKLCVSNGNASIVVEVDTQLWDNGFMIMNTHSLHQFKCFFSC